MKPPNPIFADHKQPPDPPAACPSCGGLQETTADGIQCMRCLFALALDGDESGLAEDFSWQFGDFTVSRREDDSVWELGRGAMGVTYRAHDTLLDRPVALKIVRVSTGDHTRQRTRFLHEARRAAALRHPNVASIFQYGVREADGQPFYAMELVDGETLEERVRRTGPLPAELALGVGLQIARALQAAEGRGVIHRDLKPSNVMLVHGHEGSLETFVKVIDFGLAQAASAAADSDCGQASEGKSPSFAGTPAYASPEQLAGGVVLDSRTDFYALGATLWFLLDGHSLYGGLAFDEIVRQQTRVPLPFARLPGAPGEKQILARLLGRLLEPDRSRRPQSGDELVALIGRARQALARRKARRRRAGWVSLAAVIAASLLALGWHFAKSRKWLQPSASGEPLAITVLPFDGLSQDDADAFLGGGLQQEVAGSLAGYPGLRVISPRGADRHPAGKSDQEATRELGARLGVAYAVEGNIRREDDTGRLQVQISLLDTRTGARSWSQTYGRSSTDLFALRNEIVGAVVEHLKPVGGSTLENPAASRTHAPDPVAYEMYLRAWAETDATVAESEAQYRRILHWLHEATVRDPQFARAQTEITYWEALIYLHGYDRSPAQAEKVRAAADATTRLGAETAESHDAQGIYHYYIRHDYEHAYQEFAAALRVAPNDARTLFLLGLVERRRGHWDAALEHFRLAETLDPLNVDVGRKVSSTLAGLHRYAEIDAEIAHWRQQNPHATVLLADLLDNRSEGRADTTLLHEAADLFSTAAESNTFGVEMAYTAAIYDRHPAEALRLVERLAHPMSGFTGQTWPNTLQAAWALHLLGDAEGARRSLLEARASLVQTIQKAPDPVADEMILARVNALLGQREEAIRRGRAALDQRPPSRDGYEGPFLGVQFAAVLALTGDRREAVDLLLELSRHANGPCYRDLCLDPDWDALRGDPRFEALRLSLAPKP